MSSNEIETNDVNGSRLAEQGSWSGSCSRQANIGRYHANPVNPGQNIWNRIEKPSKTGQGKKSLYLLLRVF